MSEKTLREQVTEWQSKTFPDAGVFNYMRKLVHEVDELEESVMFLQTEKEKKEIADVQIVLLGLAHKLGVDLDAEVAEKLAVNKARTWIRQADGTYQHVDKEE